MNVKLTTHNSKVISHILNHMNPLPLLPLILFYSVAHAQQTVDNREQLDVQHYQFSLQVTDTSDLIKGEAKITIRFLKALTRFELDLTAKTSTGKGMKVNTVQENGRSLIFQHTGDRLEIESTVKKEDTVTYIIVYEGAPADGLIISKINMAAVPCFQTIGQTAPITGSLA